MHCAARGCAGGFRARVVCPQYLRAQAVARSFDVPAADLDAAVPAGLLAAVEAEVGLQDGGGGTALAQRHVL